MTDDDDDNDESRELTVLICSANIGNAEPTPSSFAEWIPNDGELAHPVLSTKYPINIANYRAASNDGGYDERLSNFIHEIEKEINVDTTTTTAKGGERPPPPPNSNGRRRRFDIIVLGMQEAAFVDETPPTTRGNTAAASATTTNVTPPTVAKNDSNCDEEEEEELDVVLSRNKTAGLEESTQSRDENNNNNNINNEEGKNSSAVAKLNNGFLEISKKGAKSTIRSVGRLGLLVRSLGLATRSPTLYKNPVLKNTTAILRKGGIGNIVDPATIGSWGYDTRKFAQLITNRCPSYVVVTTSLRGQMRLVVLARVGISKDITNVYVEAENTGVGNVLANKGGIITTLTYQKTTRLSFMTAHLEAHEGELHYQNRNKNLASILSRAKTDPDYVVQDASIISHHMFIFGDLNYRTNFNLLSNETTKKKKKDEEAVNEETMDNDPSAADEDGPSQFDKAIALVDTKDYKTLYNADELSMALKKKECLVGFTTLPCNFPPTFKVQRKEGYEYNDKRIPSYTDRILWKSSDGLGSKITPLLYEPCPNFITSDHKPIRGAYLLKTNNRSPPPGRMTNVASTDSAKNLNKRKLNVLVRRLKCTHLPVMDTGIKGGKADPFVLFASYPKEMLWKKVHANNGNGAWPSTYVIPNNLNPVWKLDFPLIFEHEIDNDGSPSLSGSMLYLTVMDCDYSSGDDAIGTVALNLFDLCSDLNYNNHGSCDMSSPTSARRKSIFGGRRGSITVSNNHAINVQETNIRRPILRDGKEYGWLECTITAAYCTEKETRQFQQNSKTISKHRISIVRHSTSSHVSDESNNNNGVLARKYF